MAKLEQDFASDSKNPLIRSTYSPSLCPSVNGTDSVRYVYKQLILLNAQQALAMLFVSQIWEQLQIANQKSH